MKIVLKKFLISLPIIISLGMLGRTLYSIYQIKSFEKKYPYGIDIFTKEPLSKPQQKKFKHSTKNIRRLRAFIKNLDQRQANSVLRRDSCGE